jgi:radical SAM protein with 4Fe4S-binding SPASM domain
MGKEFSFQWHLTDLCNLRCKHCYQDNYDNRKDKSFDDIKKILYNLVNYFEDQNFETVSINLTGGEPFLFPHLIPLLEEIEKVQVIKDVNIITNGINLKDINQLNRFKKLKYLKVSLEGAREKTNDFIRGEGVFKRVINNLGNISYPFLLMFTLAKYNYKELDLMYRLAEQVGAKGFILERFIPLGEGNKIKEMVLSYKEWYEVVERVSFWIDGEVEDLLPYKAFYIDFEENTIWGALCNLGESCAIMPNGDIYPCRRFPLILGNALYDDFSIIYEKIVKFRENFSKDKLKGKCYLCPEPDCIGCRALSYSLFGDIYAEDIQCWKLQI